MDTDTAYRLYRNEQARIRRRERYRSDPAYRFQRLQASRAQRSTPAPGVLPIEVVCERVLEWVL